MLYERTMISNEKYKELIVSNSGLFSLRDSYVLEFLNLYESYKEKDLRKQIVSNFKNFILEFGHDFTFGAKNIVCKLVIQISLLTYFFMLDLCLVTIELKIDVFRPEHLRQLNFFRSN